VNNIRCLSRVVVFNAEATIFAEHATCTNKEETHNMAVEPVVSLAEVLAVQHDDDDWSGAELGPLVALLRQATSA
jgi:hypothetical protein